MTPSPARSILGLVTSTGKDRGVLIAWGLVFLLAGAAVIAIRRWWRLRRHERATVALREMDAGIVSAPVVSPEQVAARMAARARVATASAAVAESEVHAEHARAAVRGVARLQAVEVEEMLRRAGL